MTFYDTLGVAPGAAPEEIKKAYRRLSREHHPDALSGQDKAAQKAGEERFKGISEAYDTLSDPTRRAAYDRGWMRGRESAHTNPSTEPPPQQNTPRSPIHEDWEKKQEDEHYENARQHLLKDLDNNDQFLLPENDHTLLTALIDAYRFSGDGEWIVNRTESDRTIRNTIPDALYHITKDGDSVRIARKVADLREEHIRKTDFPTTNNGIEQKTYKWDDFVPESDISNTMRSEGQVGGTLTVYLEHMKILARILKDMPSDTEVNRDDLVRHTEVVDSLILMQAYHLMAHHAEKETSDDYMQRDHEILKPLRLGAPDFWQRREQDRGLIVNAEQYTAPEGKRRGFGSFFKRGGPPPGNPEG